MCANGSQNIKRLLIFHEPRQRRISSGKEIFSDVIMKLVQRWTKWIDKARGLCCKVTNIVKTLDQGDCVEKASNTVIVNFINKLRIIINCHSHTSYDILEDSKYCEWLFFFGALQLSGVDGNKWYNMSTVWSLWEQQVHLPILQCMPRFLHNLTGTHKREYEYNA